MNSIEQDVEVWKYIPGFNEKYQVSSWGAVRSFLKDANGTVLHLSKSPNGYFKVSLFGKTYSVHRLIGRAFLGLTDKMCVDHINGERDDNRLVNLRICTRRENTTFDNVKRSYKSTIVGAQWRSGKNKWVSTIRLNNESYFLGYFSTDLEAGVAYQTALHNYETLNMIPERTVCENKYKGVTFNKTRKLWQVYIFHNKKRVFLGQHESEYEASRAIENFYNGSYVKKRFKKSRITNPIH